jgi:hypothetical protein
MVYLNNHTLRWWLRARATLTESCSLQAGAQVQVSSQSRGLSERLATCNKIRYGMYSKHCSSIVQALFKHHSPHTMPLGDRQIMQAERQAAVGSVPLQACTTTTGCGIAFFLQ